MTTPQNGSVRQTFLVILATIGVLAMLAFGSCVALLGVGVSSLSKSFSSGNSTSVNASSHNKFLFATPQKSSPYIAGIKFDSEINSDFADSIISKLNYAQQDPNAVGVLFEVDSPGGVVVPSQEIYDAIEELVKIKPLVSYVRSVAASGAYYSIAPSTEIIASRGSLVGSLGVIMQGFEFSELLKSFKIQPNTLKTGTLKDAGSSFRAMTPEDKAYLKGLLDQIYATFINDVQKARPAISYKDLSFMFDGRVVLAPQAQTLKLIDLIGSQALAKTELTRLAKLKSTPDVFYYDDLKPFADFLLKN